MKSHFACDYFRFELYSTARVAISMISSYHGVFKCHLPLCTASEMTPLQDNNQHRLSVAAWAHNSRPLTARQRRHRDVIYPVILNVLELRTLISHGLLFKKWNITERWNMALLLAEYAFSKNQYKISRVWVFIFFISIQNRTHHGWYFLHTVVYYEKRTRIYHKFWLRRIMGFLCLSKMQYVADLSRFIVYSQTVVRLNKIIISVR